MVSQKIPMKGGDEQDVFSNWRRVLCYTGRSGVCKAVKRRYNKRLRQAHKMEIENVLADQA